MRLTRADKFVYWVMRLSPGGILPYDWKADWNDYLGRRYRGASPWRAYWDPGTAQEP